MSKSSLSEFQQNLAQKLLQARNNASSAQWLGFGMGDYRMLIDLGHVAEVVPITGITPLPMTQLWFSGLSNIRGSVYAVTDLSKLISAAMNTSTNNSDSALRSNRNSSRDRLLSLGGQYAPLRAALRVEQVYGLRQIKRWNEQGLLPYSSRHSVDETGITWHELNLNELLLNSSFFNIQAH